MLILTLRAETIPRAEVTPAATCGAGCGAKLPSRGALASLPAGQWTTLGVPLKCYCAADADVTKLERLLSVETDATTGDVYDYEVSRPVLQWPMLQRPMYGASLTILACVS